MLNECAETLYSRETKWVASSYNSCKALPEKTIKQSTLQMPSCSILNLTGREGQSIDGLQ